MAFPLLGGVIPQIYRWQHAAGVCVDDKASEGLSSMHKHSLWRIIAIRGMISAKMKENNRKVWK